MRIYNRIGPNTGISYTPGEYLFFWLCVVVGAAPFVAVAIFFVLAMYALAIALGILLTINGVIYHAVTGKDARIPVPGSEHGSIIEYWMEEKGWIRLPKHLTHMRSM